MNEPVVTLVGNLTADPELRYPKRGTQVANFTIASTPRRKGRDGQYEDGEPLFVRCTVWNAPADNVAASLQKGMRVIAQGRLGMQRYQDQNGNPRESLSMVVDEVGPSLRFATAQVARVTQGNSYNGAYQQQQQYQAQPPAGQYQQQYQPPAPQAPQGPQGGFDDLPPF